MYYKYVYLVGLTWRFVCIIPLGALMVLNIKLILALKKAREQCAYLSPRARGNNRQHSNLFSVVVLVTIFLVCQSLDFVQIILQRVPIGTDWITLRYTSSFALCFLAFNCGINFVIYCFFASRFKRLLIQMCSCLKKENLAINHK